MKSFQTFGTTNKLYGKFYSHGQPNKYGEEIYGDPKIEEDFKILFIKCMMDISILELI